MFALLRGFEVKFELSYVPVGGYVYLACYGTHASVTSTRSLVWQRGAMTCFNGGSLPITLSTRCSKLDSLEDKVQLFAHYIPLLDKLPDYLLRQWPVAAHLDPLPALIPSWYL